MTIFRDRVLDKLKQDKRTVARGYHLDDPEQWNDVKNISEEIEDNVTRLYLEGYDISFVRETLPDEHKWVADFMAMYHESFYKGRHGFYS